MILRRRVKERRGEKKREQKIKERGERGKV